MPILIVLLVLALVGLALLKSLSGKRPLVPDKFPYRKKDYLLTAAERSFYEVLSGIIDEQLHIFPKVRLADVLWIPKGTQNRQSHFNRIQSKQLDFVLCDRENIAPVLVIELDDASHEREDRRERDAFLDDALATAGLPILHITAKRSYVPKELADLIQEKLQ